MLSKFENVENSMQNLFSSKRECAENFGTFVFVQYTASERRTEDDRVCFLGLRLLPNVLAFMDLTRHFQEASN